MSVIKNIIVGNESKIILLLINFPSCYNAIYRKIERGRTYMDVLPAILKPNLKKVFYGMAAGTRLIHLYPNNEDVDE
jgi:hypothetical protein